MLLSAFMMVSKLKENQAVYETLAHNAVQHFRRMTETLTVKTIRKVDSEIFFRIYRRLQTVGKSTYLNYVSEIFITPNLRHASVAS
jgi:hypothetical protein